jgi:hypothetical protein
MNDSESSIPDDYYTFSELQVIGHDLDETQKNIEKQEFEQHYLEIISGGPFRSIYYSKKVEAIVSAAKLRLHRFSKKYNFEEVYDVEFDVNSIITKCPICEKTTSCNARIIFKDGNEYDILASGSGCTSVLNYYVYVTHILTNAIKRDWMNTNGLRKETNRIFYEEGLDMLRSALSH